MMVGWSVVVVAPVMVGLLVVWFTVSFWLVEMVGSSAVAWPVWLFGWLTGFIAFGLVVIGWLVDWFVGTS